MRTVFNGRKSRAAAKRGIERALSREERWVLLEEARDVAAALARRRRRPVSADDVVKYYKEKKKLNLAAMLGNAMGGLFKDQRFEATGQITLSDRIVSHANKLCTWRLRRAA